uniref:Uncharacterized protein n=1 Tax=Myotis myotis TaxID=51298 RepID=A0A7J7XH27_MYOMY|nr:hypothetical protein mMyoMyo1_011591 [Myotis myotis]
MGAGVHAGHRAPHTSPSTAPQGSLLSRWACQPRPHGRDEGGGGGGPVSYASDLCKGPADSSRTHRHPHHPRGPPQLPCSAASSRPRAPWTWDPPSGRQAALLGSQPWPSAAWPSVSRQTNAQLLPVGCGAGGSQGPGSLTGTRAPGPSPLQPQSEITGHVPGWGRWRHRGTPSPCPWGAPAGRERPAVHRASGTAPDTTSCNNEGPEEEGAGRAELCLFPS